MAKDMGNNPGRRGNDVQMAVMQNDIGYIKSKVDSIESQVNLKYVTKEEFNPVRNLVYGAAGVMLLAILGAIVSFFIVKR